MWKIFILFIALVGLAKMGEAQLSEAQNGNASQPLSNSDSNSTSDQSDNSTSSFSNATASNSTGDETPDNSTDSTSSGSGNGTSNSMDESLNGQNLNTTTDESNDSDTIVSDPNTNLTTPMVNGTDNTFNNETNDVNSTAVDTDMSNNNLTISDNNETSSVNSSSNTVNDTIPGVGDDGDMTQENETLSNTTSVDEATVTNSTEFENMTDDLNPGNSSGSDLDNTTSGGQNGTESEPMAQLSEAQNGNASQPLSNPDLNSTSDQSDNSTSSFSNATASNSTGDETPDNSTDSTMLVNGNETSNSMNESLNGQSLNATSEGNNDNDTVVPDSNTNLTVPMVNATDNITFSNETNDVNSTAVDTDKSSDNLTISDNNETSSVNSTSNALNDTVPGVGGDGDITQENETLSNTSSVDEATVTNSTEFENVTDDLNPGNSSGSDLDNTTSGGQNGTDSGSGCMFLDDLNGQWWSSIWGHVNILDSMLKAGYDANNPTLIFDCYNRNGETGTFILRVQNAMNSLDGRQSFTCVNFLRRNSDNFRVQILTERNTDNVPVLEDFPEAVNFSQLCNSKGITPIEGDLLRKGKEVEGALGCPQLLRGKFNVTYTDDTARQCPGGASMDTCDVAAKSLVYNYTTCNGTQEFQGEKRYVCVSGGLDHVTTFREATETDDFTPFACLRINQTGGQDSLDAEFRGHACGARWNDNSTSVAEVAYRLDKRDKCSIKGNSGTQLNPRSLFVFLLVATSVIASLGL